MKNNSDALYEKIRMALVEFRAQDKNNRNKAISIGNSLRKLQKIFHEHFWRKSEGKQLCPVCQGRGIVPVDFYNFAEATNNTAPQTCRTCNGIGIIESQTDAAKETIRTEREKELESENSVLRVKLSRFEWDEKEINNFKSILETVRQTLEYYGDSKRFSKYEAELARETLKKLS